MLKHYFCPEYLLLFRISCSFWHSHRCVDAAACWEHKHFTGKQKRWINLIKTFTFIFEIISWKSCLSVSIEKQSSGTPDSIPIPIHRINVMINNKMNRIENVLFASHFVLWKRSCWIGGPTRKDRRTLKPSKSNKTNSNKRICRSTRSALFLPPVYQRPYNKIFLKFLLFISYSSSRCVYPTMYSSQCNGMCWDALHTHNGRASRSRCGQNNDNVCSCYYEWHYANRR